MEKILKKLKSIKKIIFKKSNNIVSNDYEWDKLLVNACLNGSKKLAEYAIQKGARDWNRGLRSACSAGQIDMCKYMINKGATDFKNALYNASINGNKQIFDYLFNLEKNSLTCWGLIGSCEKRDWDMIEYIISKGVNDNDWNTLLWCACYSGHKDIVDYMIQKGASVAPLDWNMGLRGACRRGNKHIVDYMIQKGARDWNSGLHMACVHNHQDLVDYMIRMGANKIKHSHNSCQCLNKFN
jgi:ankyrin repeat protein